MNITLWGKTKPKWESLQGHMKAVGNVSVKILKESIYEGLLDDMKEWTNLPEEELLNDIKYLAAMHDIGKAHPSFQIKNGQPLPKEYEDDIEPYFRHERIIPKIAAKIWKDWDIQTRIDISTALSLHHQHGNKEELLPRNKKWEDLWFEIEKEMREWSHFKGISVEDFSNIDAFCTTLTGLIIISDWIASSQNADNAFKNLDFQQHSKLTSFDFKEKFGYDPRTFQQEVMNRFGHEMPLLTVIEAPPGEGKTELAIWLAHKMGEYWGKKGIYFALPTAATSNQMFDRVKEYLKDNVLLIHSMSWLRDMEVNEWTNPTRKGILSRYAVGTVDQIMMAVLKVRYGVLRLFGITNKVVIIDEIHAYDAYMTAIIKRLVEWLMELHIPCIMLSATLPKERKETLLGINNPEPKYPLVTNIYENGHAEQFSADTVYRHMEADIELVRGFDNVKRPRGMVCIIANTVRKAQEIYDKIEGPKILFHGKFTAKLKEKIEKEVVKKFSKNAKRTNFTLVATQVVEQSLDIDFDCLITEIAPIDLLFQRLGRLHRFDIPNRGKAKCIVFYDSEYGKRYGASEYVYPKILLEKTEKILSRIKTVNIPNDIRDMIENVYSKEIKPNEIEDFLSREQETAMLCSEATISTISKPTKDSFCFEEDFSLNDDDFVARTRLGTGYKLCILPKDLYDIAISGNATAEQAREINEYSTPVTKDYDGVDGTGRFLGYRFRIGTADSPTETSVSEGYKETLVMDKEKGLCLMS